MVRHDVGGRLLSAAKVKVQLPDGSNEEYAINDLLPCNTESDLDDVCAYSTGKVVKIVAEDGSVPPQGPGTVTLEFVDDGDYQNSAESDNSRLTSRRR